MSEDSTIDVLALQTDLYIQGIFCKSDEDCCVSVCVIWKVDSKAMMENKELGTGDCLKEEQDEGSCL